MGSGRYIPFNNTFGRSAVVSSAWKLIRIFSAMCFQWLELCINLTWILFQTEHVTHGFRLNVKGTCFWDDVLRFFHNVGPEVMDPTHAIKVSAVLASRGHSTQDHITECCSGYCNLLIPDVTWYRGCWHVCCLTVSADTNHGGFQIIISNSNHK